MLARRRTLIAAVLLVGGWIASAALVPALRPFMLGGLHFDCFWGTNGPAWSCEDDPGPNLIVPITELVLAGVAVPSLAVVLLRTRRGPRSARDRGRVALIVLAALPSAYALLLVGSAITGLDTAVGATQHLGDFWWLAWSTVSALVVACVALVLLALLPERSWIFAAAACLAWAALLLVGPGLAWLLPFGLALLASLLLTAPAVRVEEPVRRVAGRV